MFNQDCKAMLVALSDAKIDFLLVMPAVLTLIAIGLFVAGVRSFASLKRIDGPTNLERSDPFFTPVTLLFSTTRRSDEFRSVQRRTIWLFCSSMLLLYMARFAFMQSDAG